jgi:hypothetical protein
MAMLVKFTKKGNPKGYLPGRKKDWKRMVSKARRRWAKKFNR